MLAGFRSCYDIIKRFVELSSSVGPNAGSSQEEDVDEDISTENK